MRCTSVLTIGFAWGADVDQVACTLLERWLGVASAVEHSDFDPTQVNTCSPPASPPPDAPLESANASAASGRPSNAIASDATDATAESPQAGVAGEVTADSALDASAALQALKAHGWSWCAPTYTSSKVFTLEGSVPHPGWLRCVSCSNAFDRQLIAGSTFAASTSAPTSLPRASAVASSASLSVSSPRRSSTARPPPSRMRRSARQAASHAGCVGCEGAPALYRTS